MDRTCKFTVVIQHAETQLYLARAEIWTRRLSEARDFVHVESASRFVLQWGLKDTQILLSFDDPLYDVVLPCGGN